MTDPLNHLASYVEEQLRIQATAEEMRRMIRDLPDLLESVQSTDLCATLPMLAGLMTVPDLQPNLIRLEALVHMVVARAAGTIQPSRELFDLWLNEDLAADILTRAEDPVEDVFVTNVVTGGGNRRIFTGIWETPDFWLQSLIDVLAVAPRTPQLNKIRSETDSLLRLSEVVAERSKAPRFSISGGTPASRIALPSATDLSAVSSRCRFSLENLDERGIRRELLSPFVFALESRAHLEGQQIGGSGLQRRPLVACGDTLVVAIPQAIATALRVYVLEAVAGLGRSSFASFEHVLRRIQSGALFGEALRFSKGLTDATKGLPRSSIDAKRLSQIAVVFDEGKFAHVVLLHDDCEAVLDEGLTSMNRPPEGFAKKLAAYLESCARQLSLSPGYVGGMTLIVLGGGGRGFAFIPPTVPKDWTLCVWSLADVCALAWMEHEWLLKLWKLYRQVAQTAKNEIEIQSSDANLYSFWKENNYRLIPREYPLRSKHGMLSLGPEYIAPFRQTFRASFDGHAVYRPDERSWIVVRKTFPIGFFKEIESLPMYASPDDAARGQLRGVVETSSRAWWLDCITSESEGDERELQFHIWQAGLNWLARLAPEMEIQIRDLPASNILVQLDLTKARLRSSQGNLVSRFSGSSVTVSINHIVPTITVTIHDSFLGLLQRPTNDGERELVRAMAEGALSLSKTESARAISEQIASAVITSTDARFLHVFTSPPSVRDELAQFERPTGRTVQEPDGALTTVDLAWHVLEPKEEGVEISGQDECNQFLNATVDALWGRIRASLERIERKAFVEQCLRNHEGVQLDRDLWRRTSRALTAVYKDRDDVIAAAHKHEAGFSRATLSSRVLVEMSVCTCPLGGGSKPGVAEFDELLAAVARLIALAYDSDAMRAGLSEPNIRVFPNGEFVTSSKFYETVLLPYHSGHFAERFEESLRRYPDLYKAPQRVGRPVEEVFDQEFVSAFESEYGFPLQQLVLIGEVLEERAVNKQKIVDDITLKDMEHLLVSRAGLTSAHVDAFVRNFCFAPRERWDFAPIGFVDKDWFPWRFRRRLSLMARPIVRTGLAEHDPLFYAPGLVRDGFANLVVGSHSGGFNAEYFASVRMRAWIGAINNKKGHEFNEQVAEEFRKLNFQARASVQMAEFNVAHEMGDLGDIDVLAWSTSGPVYIVECKNLRFAMTVGEIADQLKRFRGEANDDLKKHMKRCQWLDQNLDRLAKIIARDGSLKIKPLLVSNTIVPMQFSRDLPIPAEDILSIRALPQRMRGSDSIQ
jgi:hypothetical protein